MISSQIYQKKIVKKKKLKENFYTKNQKNRLIYLYIDFGLLK